MVTEAEVRDKIFSFLKGSISLSNFEDWIVLHGWNTSRDPVAADLIADVELALSEYSSSHLSDLEFRARLLEANGQFVVNVRLDDDTKVVPNFQTTKSASLVRTAFVHVPA